MKKILIIMVMISFIVLTGCHKETTNKTNVFDPDENLDTDNTFFDDFTNGIDMNKWEIAYQKWGVGNNGVTYKNVNYTNDGIVILQVNGDLYDGDIVGVNSSDGTRTGAALVSNDALGPGRYEVRMKILPRFGSTTAFWTYYNNGTVNDEIDIELNVGNDFKQVWFTNWVTENDKDHHVIDTDIVNNDGEWHTYKFEWHTNPKRIDYYIDDHLFYTSTSYVPTHAGRLWIGNWFPDSWAGVPDFETDYTFVDWVKYTPYLNNPYEETPSKTNNIASRYPTEPIELPQTNLISNAGFEGKEEAWRLDENSQVQIVDRKGMNQTHAIEIPANEIAYQYLTGMNDQFEITVNVNAKFDSQTSDGGKILIECLPLDSKILGTEVIQFSSSDTNFENNAYYEKTITFTVPVGTRRLRFNLIGGTTGNIYFDNLYTNLTKKLPS